MKLHEDGSVTLSKQEYEALVFMRQSQKAYFAMPCAERLSSAKHYEKQVDKMLGGQQAMEIDEL